MPMPNVIPLTVEHCSQIMQIASRYIYLPHPKVVEQLPGRAFPTIRANNQHPRFTVDDENAPQLMYDDNTTPRWALLWAHGIPRSSHPSDWMFAHVWEAPQDVDAYTNISNLVMVPHQFGTLTDRNGALTAYLRYHAFAKYHWLPNNQAEPPVPDAFQEIEWQYFPLPDTAPADLIRQRLLHLKNERVTILCRLMNIR